MKKLSILASLAMLFALTACGSSNSSSGDSTSAVDTVQGDNNVPTDTTVPTDTIVPKDSVVPVDTTPPADTVNPCDKCSPYQTCEAGVCKDPANAQECPYGGIMLSEDCGDVPDTRCCAGTELYYCMQNDEAQGLAGCPEGIANCLCKLDCATLLGDDGVSYPYPYCSFLDSYGLFLCSDAEAFPPADSEVAPFCPWVECTPACTGKVCGGDGCGGSCGTCEAGFKCDDAGTCQVCTPNCTDKVCGDDGCGGSCGTCAAETDICGEDGKCYAASCEGLCGGDVAAPAGCYCDASCEGYGDCCPDICTQCEELNLASCCVPSCDGKVCGDDGCGGLCGPDLSCPDDKVCAEDQSACVAAPACDPSTCTFPWQICRHGECVDPTTEGSYCLTGGYLLGEDCHGVAEVGCCAGAPSYYCGTAANQQCPEGMDTCLCLLDCPSVPSVCGWDPLALDGHMNCLETADPAPEGVEFSCPGYTCIPDCLDKACGNDGCGGTCGTCADGEDCTTEFQCCASECSSKGGTKVCGLDVCGNNCGVCASGFECNADGACKKTCVPACDGKVCGDNGCGGTCGTCDEGKTCDAGLCVPNS